VSKFGFVGPSYTAKSNVVANEECINFFAETIETPGAQTQRSYFGTPGLGVFTSLPDSPERGQCWTGSRWFAVGGSTLFEVYADGTQDVRGDVGNDGQAVSIVASNVQLLIISAGRAFCFTLATNTLTEVTSLLAGVPKQCDYSDGYFIVCFEDSNKFQMSDILDGTVWPGIQVNAVSVFAENIVGIIVSHRELWVFGSQHIQPYQDTGSDEVFDVIPGSLIDAGLLATFGRNLVDNTIFWISEDTRGGRQAWRANGYTPQRISTHAVETALSSYPLASVQNMVSYAYQDGGHLFWVLYIPSTDCTWVYDVAEGLWAKRAEWHQDTATWGPHRSWNHSYAFGQHIVGDWQTGNLYVMSMDLFDDSGLAIRRVRRSPTLVNEMDWIFHSRMIVDFATGVDQPQLVDGDGNPRPPQAMLRWSDDRGSTWSNEYVRDCGFAGEFKTRVQWLRLGRSRYRVYELSVTDPIPWVIVDSYIRLG
jgi:hypothetical protein